MTKKELSALKKITGNFENGFFSSTLLSFTPTYDSKGRPLTCDPNYREGNVTIGNKTFWFVRKGWIVRVWDRGATYHDYMSNKNDFVREIDLIPSYIKKTK